MKSPAGSMEHLYLPPSLRYFVPVGTDGMNRAAHACFEYDLVEALRPEMLVDLGAGDARSFTVFCRSMKDHDIDGLAYAVDVWESDAQREAEGATSLTAINNFLHTHFRGCAYLLRQNPEQALSHFADGSVDLLRIDLDRAERPANTLLDAWTPKLKPGAVLLCTGVSGRKKALEALRPRSPVVIPGNGGLAVVIHEPSATADSSSWLLRAIAEGQAGESALVGFYEHVARHHALRAEILEQGQSLYRKPGG